MPHAPCFPKLAIRNSQSEIRHPQFEIVFCRLPSVICRLAPCPMPHANFELPFNEIVLDFWSKPQRVFAAKVVKIQLGSLHPIRPFRDEH